MSKNAELLARKLQEIAEITKSPAAARVAVTNRLGQKFSHMMIADYWTRVVRVDGEPATLEQIRDNPNIQTHSELAGAQKSITSAA